MGLRILIASDHYPPYIGGAHRQTELLAKELLQRGHEVSVVTVWSPGLAETEDDQGVRVYRLKQIRTLLPWLNRGRGQRHQPPFPDPVTVLGLRKIIKAAQPEIIHSYGWLSFSVAVALQGYDIPLLISARDYGYSCPTRSLLHHGRTCSGPALAKCLSCAAEYYGGPKGWMAVLGVFFSRPILAKRIDAVHSVSQYVQGIIERDLIGNQAASRKYEIIKKDISSFLIPSDQETGDPDFVKRLPAQPYILYVGGLQRRKGLDQLLEAYEKLDSPPPLVLIGYSAADMPKQFPPNVLVLQDVSHANVMEAWERCLFGVIPSLWPDPSPGVVREAMSKGKAVVVTSVGGSTEMIGENRNGLLVPPGDVEELARAMRCMIDHKDYREELGQAGLEWSKQYMAEAVVPQFEQLYQQVIYKQFPVELSQAGD